MTYNNRALKKKKGTWGLSRLVQHLNPNVQVVPKKKKKHDQCVYSGSYYVYGKIFYHFIRSPLTTTNSKIMSTLLPAVCA